MDVKPIFFDQKLRMGVLMVPIIEKYKEFENKLEKKDLVLGKGLNWQLYTQKPLPVVVQKDKILEHHGNYVGTFIEV